MTLRDLISGLLDAERILREAKDSEEGAVTATSYARLVYEVDSLTRTIIIRTDNAFFAGDRDEARRGKLGEWTIVWERRDIGVPTGEDYLPEELREWLLGHTRMVSLAS